MTLSNKIKEAYAALEYNYDRMRDYEDGRRIMAKALKDSAEVIARVERYEAALRDIASGIRPNGDFYQILDARTMQQIAIITLSEEDTCKS